MSDAQFGLAGQAWRAFREPTPEPLDSLRRSDTTALPFLSRADAAPAGAAMDHRRVVAHGAAAPDLAARPDSNLLRRCPACTRGRLLRDGHGAWPTWSRRCPGPRRRCCARTERLPTPACRARRPGRSGRRLWHRSMAWRHPLTQRQRVAVDEPATRSATARSAPPNRPCRRCSRAARVPAGGSAGCRSGRRRSAGWRPPCAR